MDLDRAEMTKPLQDAFGPDPRKVDHECALLRRRLILYFQHHQTSDAEDRAHEVWSRLMEKLSEPATGSAPLTADDVIRLSFGIAGYVAMEDWRKKRKDARTEELPPDNADRDVRIVTQGPDPEERLLAQEEWRLVQGCLQTLEAADRELLLSWYLEEKKTHKVLASRLGINANALRIRIHRILERVRECVGKMAAKKGI